MPRLRRQHVDHQLAVFLLVLVEGSELPFHGGIVDLVGDAVVFGFRLRLDRAQLFGINEVRHAAPNRVAPPGRRNQVAGLNQAIARLRAVISERGMIGRTAIVLNAREFHACGIPLT
jgi:hypothetical protein